MIRPLIVVSCMSREGRCGTSDVHTTQEGSHGRSQFGRRPCPQGWQLICGAVT